MKVIIVSGLIVASTADILQGGRLQTVPANGILAFEIQAADNVAANNYVVSIELPDGATPLNGVLMPGGETAGLAGIIDSRTAFRATFMVGQGGHCVFSCVETGDTELYFRVVFKGR